MRVWTKQHKDVLKILEETNRFVCNKQYVLNDLEEHAFLMLEAYDWLVNNNPRLNEKHDDSHYPIWLSLSKDDTMLISDDFVIIEMEVDEKLINYIDINKWTRILNYSYIPINKEDELEHQKLLTLYNISDAQAYMSQFHPIIKKKIINSWNRLFDSSVSLGSDKKYGNIWEVKKEWIIKIEQ